MKNHAAESLRAVFRDDEELRDTFYREAPVEIAAPKSDAPALASLDASGKRRKAQKPKPDHYEIICISIYKDDLARLDAKVDELKRRGHRRMTRSALIRYALDRVAIDDVPRGSF